MAILELPDHATKWFTGAVKDHLNAWGEPAGWGLIAFNGVTAIYELFGRAFLGRSLSQHDMAEQLRYISRLLDQLAAKISGPEDYQI